MVLRLFCGVIVFFFLNSWGRTADTLANDFESPPPEAKPWVYEWWFNGWVDQEGITKHLEELKDKGIGGGILFSTLSTSIPNGNNPFMGQGWRNLVKFSEAESNRLGLQFGLNICEGWPAGGPWIPKEDSPWIHQESATVIVGPCHYHQKVPDIAAANDKTSQNIAVFAYPIPESATAANIPKLTASSHPETLPYLLAAPDYKRFWGTDGPTTPDHPQWIQLEYPQPKEADYVWIGTGFFAVPSEVEIQSSTDGNNFTTVGKLHGNELNPVVGAIPPTVSRFYRFVFKSPGPMNIHALQLGTRVEVDHVAMLAAKALRTSSQGPSATPVLAQETQAWIPLVQMPGESALRIKDCIDLTGKVTEDGVLDWEVPAGRWKLIRIGAMATGLTAGGGYMTDYLNPEAMDLHFDKFMSPLIDDAGPLAGSTFQYFYEDNPETVRIYSWTPHLLEEFQRRRGYDARPYLAALGGDLIEDAATTDRFLQDFRRTVADCIADYHYGEWTKRSHARGMKTKAEAGGQYLPLVAPVDGLMNLGRVDGTAGEFWESENWKESQENLLDPTDPVPAGWEEGAQNYDLKQAASASHIYGKKLVAAEAFTSLGPRAHWGTGPADLLLYANIAFCEGVNRYHLHSSTIQKGADGKPGYEYDAGTHFDPRVTWWSMSRPFFSFVGRCEAMLQRGLFSADVLYYNGDDVPNIIPPKHVDPSLGPGYDYDVCNTEVLLTRLSIKDDRLVLPDGMSYRILVLPELQNMPLKAVQKITEMVRAGATVVGPKPLRVMGLKDYKHDETDLAEITNQVWGACNGKEVTENACGRGHVYWGRTLRDVLGSLGVTPDFSYASEDKQALLDFIHRKDGDAEIYFIANRRNRTVHFSSTFRVSGLQPEIWNPFTGEMREATAFKQEQTQLTLPLELNPYGSTFVVFRRKIAPQEQGPARKNFVGFTPFLTLDGPWQVKFDPAWGGPVSVTFDALTDWTDRGEAGIRYYSGTATYVKEFVLPPLPSHSPCYLDLGTVKEVANIRVNGHDAGIAWCPPYRVDISKWVKPGINQLEIDVANLWPNRLIGDASLPPAQRLGKTNIPFSPQQPLLPSGLIGPVHLENIAER